MIYHYKILLLFFMTTNGVDCGGILISLYTSENSKNVSTVCSNRMDTYMEGLKNGELWALNMLDATSKIPVGILQGNLVDMGSFDQCISTKSIFNNYTIKGKYCLGTITLPVEIEEKKSEEGNGTKIVQTKALGWSACFPHECESKEVETIYTHFMEDHTGIYGLQILLQENMCQYQEETGLSVEATVVLILFGIILLLIIISTIYDVTLQCYCKNKLQNLWTSFSLNKNTRKILSATSSVNQLQCLGGLKFISMIWIIFLHQYSIYKVTPIANLNAYNNYFNSLLGMYVYGGTFAVDTFFVISGLLTVFAHIRNLNKNVKVSLHHYYLHRIIRLSPAFIAGILFSATLLEYLISGPYKSYFVMGFEKPCREKWWSALLYIQNYVNVESMCMGHTWYLCIDMQLYIISPLLLKPIEKFPKTIIGIVTGLTFASILTSFLISWNLNLTGVLTNEFGDKDLFMNNYYLLTHTRASAWFIGFICGYIITKSNNSSMQISKPINICLWIFSIAVMLLCTFGGYSTLRSQVYDRWGNAFYIALIRPVWCIAISWIIFACTRGFGGIINTFLSLRFFQVMAKLTYCMYLVHVTLLYGIAYNIKYPRIFNNFDMLYYFAGDCLLIVFIAYIWMLMFEMPLQNLESFLLN